MRSQDQIVEFQSSVERDFAILCDFTPEVNHVRWQPFSIEFRDLVLDKTRIYTPDYLVETTSRRGERYSYIAEIKRYKEYSRIYEADPVGEASRAHIAAMEWARAQPLSEMVVITDRWLASRGIANIKRIRAAAGAPVEPRLREVILSAVLTNSPVRVREITDICHAEGYAQAEVVAAIFRLCDDDLCHIDISSAFSGESVVHEGSRSRIFRF